MATTFDTGTTDVLAVVDDGVATVTLNRPERRNAMSDTMLQGLGAALTRFEHDPDVAVVVLTGAGGAFCAGGDVKGMAERGALPQAGARADATLDDRVRLQRHNQKMTAGRLHKMAKPTIASIPGATAGAGMSLAMACDFRIAADTAVFTTAFAGVALAGDYGSAWFLTRLVGTARARELLLVPERLSAADADRHGLLHRVVPSAELADATAAFARKLADGPRHTLAFMKENLNLAMHATLDDYMDTEVFHHVFTSTTPDHREAAAAFVEKRAPRFGQGG
jgi:2-(1,2-epoxy-1,2-dihydrophenyl)acetyl-CoA isomerase